MSYRRRNVSAGTLTSVQKTVGDQRCAMLQVWIDGVETVIEEDGIERWVDTSHSKVFRE